MASSKAKELITNLYATSTKATIGEAWPETPTVVLDPQLLRLRPETLLTPPKRILVPVTCGENAFCLIDILPVSRVELPGIPFYTMRVVEHPLQYVGGGLWSDEYSNWWNQPIPIVKKETDTTPETLTFFMLDKSKFGVVCKDKTVVPQCGTMNPLRAFPPEFVSVQKGLDISQRWHFVAGRDLGCFRHKIKRPASKNTIPIHVFHAFAESAIQKKENCPITLEPLTKESVACPPCGHLFSYEALVQALQSSGKCPACRAKAKVEEIQWWS